MPDIVVTQSHPKYWQRLVYQQEMHAKLRYVCFCKELHVVLKLFLKYT